MVKRVVVALGGNALGDNLTEQMTAVKDTSKAIADLIEAGYEVILSHGNECTSWDDPTSNGRTFIE